MAAKFQEVFQTLSSSVVDVELSPQRQTRILQADHEPRLIYNPSIEQERDGLTIYGMKHDRSIKPWGVWGGLFLASTLLFVFAYKGTSGMYSPWDWLWFMIAVSIGALMVRLGAKTSLRRYALCEVDVAREIIRWDASASSELENLALSFDEVTEIVFGMTYYPVSEKRVDVKVHAFTLLVRDAYERLIPVIEASPNKQEAYQIAQTLSQTLGLGITYVGHGIQS